MDFSGIIEQLEAEWDTDGFFDHVRNGDYDDTRAKNILNILHAIKCDEDELLPKRLVTLLWYLPSFLGWQTERVVEKGGDSAAYQRFTTEVLSTLEDVLDTPVIDAVWICLKVRRRLRERVTSLVSRAASFSASPHLHTAGSAKIAVANL